jgi:hypothetical protein
MDLEKAYDSVDRKTMWEVLMMYGVGGKILSAIKSMPAEIMVCHVCKNRSKFGDKS